MNFQPRSALFLAAVCTLPPSANALDVPASLARIDASLAQSYPQLDALYKDIHSYPELGFQEQATAAKLAVQMRALGFEVTEGIAKTGVVAIYRNGPGRTAKAVGKMTGAEPPAVTVTPGGNAVVNDESLTAQTAAVFKAAFGDKAKPQTPPGAASEDYFDFIIADLPSVFFSIGGSDPARVAELRAAGKPVPANHSPFFAPTPEPSIRTGVRAMTLAVLNAMQ